MSELTKALDVLSGSAKKSMVSIGTVISISSADATVAVKGANVAASAYCSCSAGDRVLCIYSNEHRRYFIIGKLQA